MLGYSRLQARWHLPPERIKEFAARVATLAEIVQPAATASSKVVLADPDDDAIVRTAVAGRADVLCIRDVHLTHPPVLQFRSRHGVRIMDDIELYRTLHPR